MASLVTETNTFSSIPTSLRSYLEMGYSNQRGSPQINLVHREWRLAAQQEGHEVIESITAESQPAGPTLRAVYEQLRDDILNDISQAGHIDIILLWLHGAMVADGYEDCEGDIIRRIRALVGANVKIGVELDLHCHLTADMTNGADILVTYKEYPHTDIRECAREVYSLTMKVSLAQIEPAKSVYDCGIIGLWPTTREPVCSFVARLRNLEGRNGVMSVSLIHSFPWSDVSDVGAKILVISDGDQKLANTLAEKLGREWWGMREESSFPLVSIDNALKHVQIHTLGVPIVLADVADNAGGGAPSDNTSILRGILDIGVQDIAIGCFWDPGSVQMCFDAGIGATLDLRIGGKVSRYSDLPVDVIATVRGLCADHRQTGIFSPNSNLGPSAYVEVNRVHIVLSTIREQVYYPDLFTSIGCTLSDKRAVVVKSAQHFYNGFRPIAQEILYVAGSGPLSPDFARIRYTKLSRPLWPQSD